MEIILTAKVKAKLAHIADVEKQLRSLAKLSQEEEGCLLYALHQDVNDPATFLLIERWASKEALDYHYSLEHFVKYSKEIPSFIVSPPEVTFLRSLNERGSEKGSI